MAHELTARANGRVEMAYTGETPWHGLGNVLEPGATIEAWTEAAGMDWRIQRSVVRFATERGQDGAAFAEMTDQHVLMRSDTKTPLGIVSDKYHTVQPQAVLEFFRDLCDAGGFTLSTAGTLFGGRRFWALAQVGADAIILDPRDKIKGNLLLSTSADGTMATEARFVATRVVCNNTLRVAIGEKGATSVKVTHRSKFRPDDVKKTLGVGLSDRLSETVSELRRLAATPLSRNAAALATAELLEPGAAKLARDELEKLLKSKPVTRINELALGGGLIGGGLEGVHGTAWGWLNAVTQYVDHEARARSQDNRLNSAWFGRGADLKARALELVGVGSSGESNVTRDPELAARFGL